MYLVPVLNVLVVLKNEQNYSFSLAVSNINPPAALPCWVEVKYCGCETWHYSRWQIGCVWHLGSCLVCILIWMHSVIPALLIFGLSNYWRNILPRSKITALSSIIGLTTVWLNDRWYYSHALIHPFVNYWTLGLCAASTTKKKITHPFSQLMPCCLGTGVINNRGIQSHHPSHTARLSTREHLPWQPWGLWQTVSD